MSRNHCCASLGTMAMNTSPLPITRLTDTLKSSPRKVCNVSESAIGFPLKSSNLPPIFERGLLSHPLVPLR